MIASGSASSAPRFSGEPCGAIRRFWSSPDGRLSATQQPDAANEWAPKGINVNAIAPGYMATDNTAALRADATRSRQILERIPAGRWGTPQDLAGVAVFLASPASDYIHGTVLTVDGGWMGR